MAEAENIHHIYLPRRFQLLQDGGSVRLLSEKEFLALAGPKVVLGEPGMGKSEFMSAAGRYFEAEIIRASRFMLSKRADRFVSASKPLLIDGLDEAMARGHGDAIDLVLTQLADIDCPDFVLTCRSREWQARTATNLFQIYKSPVQIATIEQFDRVEAAKFLAVRNPTVDAELVLSHLDTHGIADFYANPLMLGLMGTVAQSDKDLPATRAALFECVCALTWPEHDRDRHDLALSQLNENNALSAAGAIMASLMLAGAESLVTFGPIEQSGEILLADVEALPHAQAAALIAGSKLFVSAGQGRVQPIHRVIAEYLGARWLAECSSNSRLRRRVLAQLQDSGAVPASLRGLHSWLAHHNTHMIMAVIRADPFGVLRYGETENFTETQIMALFEALQHLTEDDPYFLHQSRDDRTAAGLMILPLLEKIKSVITAGDSNTHLCVLLVEGIVGTPLAGHLTDTLEHILFSKDRWYRQRSAASQALQPFRDVTWWRQTVQCLHDQASEDSSRLARQIVENLACDVPDDLLVSVLYAELGLSFCPLPRDNETDVYTYRDYRKLVGLLPSIRLVPVLDMLAQYASMLRSSGRRYDVDFSHISEIASTLLVRAIEEKVVTQLDAAKVWDWLGLASQECGYIKRERTILQAVLDMHDNLRRAIQGYALYTLLVVENAWQKEIKLQKRLIGLTHRRIDLIWFFEQLQSADITDPKARKAWGQLMQLGTSIKDFYADVLAASRLFQRDDPQLALIAHQLEHPMKPDWVLDEERRKVDSEQKQRNEKIKRQKSLQNKRADLSSGELSVCPRTALMYLGLFYEAEKFTSERERLTHWIGEDFVKHAMAGFEATLFRSDLPSPADIAMSFIDGQMWMYGYSIIAGLHARNVAGSDLADLPNDVLVMGLLLAYDERCHQMLPDFKPLISALEKLVLPTPETRVRFAKLWIEPALKAKATYVGALRLFIHDERWRQTALCTVPEWLQTFSNLPLQTEMELVDSIAYPSASTELVVLAKARINRLDESKERMLSWLAVDMMVRFDETLPELSEIASHHPEFLFFIRDRLHRHESEYRFNISVPQAVWLVAMFRKAWPETSLRGSSIGNRNPHDASSFLRNMMTRIADDTADAAMAALQTLISGDHDTYTNLIRHMAVEQRQKRAEKSYTSIGPLALATLLSDGPPTTIDDLRTLVLEQLESAQQVLKGDDLDQVRDFWSDENIPYNENRCRDRLAAIIGPELARYGIERITEADMPHTKRADMAFAYKGMQLPMEVKGQWHEDVWSAATDQLDAQYLIDWRSQKRGIYCVLWFGNLLSKTARRLQPPPTGVMSPVSAEAMRDSIKTLIPASRRDFIDVVVLDLTRSQPETLRKR